MAIWTSLIKVLRYVAPFNIILAEADSISGGLLVHCSIVFHILRYLYSFFLMIFPLQLFRTSSMDLSVLDFINCGTLS